MRARVGRSIADRLLRNMQVIESGTFKQVQETYTHLVEQLRPVMEVGQAEAVPVPILSRTSDLSLPQPR